MLKAIISDHTFPSIEVQRNIIEAAGFELTELRPNCVSADDVIERCAQADTLLVQWAPVTRRVLESLPRLRGVVRYGIGVDNIDLNAARDLGIGVANVSTYCLEEVSNHAMAMILSLIRRIPHDQFGILHGGWGVADLLPIAAAADLTIGLIGFGSVARLVARKARAFGFTILAVDPYQPASVFEQAEVKQVSFDELLAVADVISLHCPLLPETAHLIRSETLKKMKPGVFIVNTARGGLVRETDLIQALESRHVLGAGLDVFEKEPLPGNSPFRQLPNVILTSHAASVSTSAVKKLQIKAAESANAFLSGDTPESTLVRPLAFQERVASR